MGVDPPNTTCCSDDMNVTNMLYYDVVHFTLTTVKQGKQTVTRESTTFRESSGRVSRYLSFDDVPDKNNDDGESHPNGAMLCRDRQRVTGSALLMSFVILLSTSPSSLTHSLYSKPCPLNVCVIQ